MVAAAVIRSAFERLGFTADAANTIMGDQQIDTIEELRLLTDSEAENLCKVIRRPGGTIPNPNGAAGATMSNPGISVSLRAENNLKLACYWLRHNVRISRNCDFPDITVVTVRSIKEMRTNEEAYKAPSATEAPKIND